MSLVTHLALAFALLAVAAAIAHGWGAAVLRLARMPDGPWPVTATLGVAALLALGGVLNLARLAYAPALGLLAAGGLALFVHAAPWRQFRRPRPGDVLAGVAAALIVAFAVATQLPSAFANHHDDLEKYFAHPVRMLATGTVLGSPLSTLGSSTLGGSAFLHGFTLAVLPIRYVNGVDAVFGLALMLGLGMAAAARWLRAQAGAVLAVLLIAAIEPQYVNVSPLYLGAALMATVLLVGTASRDALPPPLAAGLAYAGLVALKPTLVLFPLLHAPLAAAAALAAGARPGAVLRASLATAAWATLALAPWLLVHLPNYLGPAADAVTVPDAVLDEEIHWWSAEPVQYGASMTHYTALAIMGLAVAIAAGVATFRGSGATRAAAAALAAAALAGSGAWLVFMLLSPALAGPATHLRLATPFLIGTVPLGLIAGASLAIGASARARERAVFALLAGATLAFLPATLDRYARAQRHHTILAYVTDDTARNSQFAGYFRQAFADAAAAEVRRLQEQVPAGEPLLAWTLHAHLLDFARNPVVDVDPSGLATPWARVPDGVRYVIWERYGPAVRGAADYGEWLVAPGRGERAVAAHTVGFVQWLERQAAAGETLHADSRYVVFRLADENSSVRSPPSR